MLDKKRLDYDFMFQIGHGLDDERNVYIVTIEIPLNTISAIETLSANLRYPFEEEVTTKQKNNKIIGIEEVTG